MTCNLSNIKQEKKHRRIDIPSMDHIILDLLNQNDNLVIASDFKQIQNRQKDKKSLDILFYFLFSSVKVFTTSPKEVLVNS